MDRAVCKRSQTAGARFRAADALVEAFVAVRIPRGLRFGDKDPTKVAASKKRLISYIRDKGKKLGIARKPYIELVRLGESPWDTASRLRIGQLFLEFAVDLIAGPIPTPPVPAALRGRGQDVRAFTEAFNDAFCSTLAGKAVPLLKKARESLQQCVLRARPSEPLWRGRCEDAMKRLERARATMQSPKPKKKPKKKPKSLSIAEASRSAGPALLIAGVWPQSSGVACAFKAKKWPPRSGSGPAPARHRAAPAGA